jgi:hypothetical protein
MNRYLEELNELTGKRLAEVRPFTTEEYDLFYWDSREDAVVLIFEDGTALIPMRDPEGNGAGHLSVASVEVI